MQCNAILSVPFGVGKSSSWVRVYMWLQREREGLRKKTSLSESYQSLFSSSSRTVSFRQRHTHTHTHECLSRDFLFKRCNFDAIVCFAVSLDVEEKKKEYWTAPFYFFFFFFFFLGFVFVMKGWREATKSCCSAARTRMVV